MSDKYYTILIGFVVAVVVAPIVINLATRFKLGQNILSYVDKHQSKQGTPTMGGIIFLIPLLVCFLINFGDDSRLSTIVVLVTFGYALLGFLDDYLKIKLKHNEGLKPYQKLVGQLGIAIIVSIFVYKTSMVSNGVLLPFGFDEIDLNWVIIPFVILFFVAVTNSVNLTDGLDGLAGGVTLINVLCIALVLGEVVEEGNLVAPVAEYGNLILLSYGLVGALMGYLIFNSYPASIFMGDTGSLALGGFIASVLTFSGLYVLMFFVGIMFVINTLSVVLQVFCYKITKKRIFKMAPLHHHFEQCGVRETKIVFSYEAISVIMLIVSLIIF